MFNQMGVAKVKKPHNEYKDAFSLRDEIGTCPNIKVEIDMSQIVVHSS